MELKTRIPDYNLHWLEKKINKLNEKALKLNCEPIIIKVLSEEIIKNQDGIVEVFKNIKIKGSSPKLKNWRLIGKLEQIKPGENLVLNIPGEIIPLRYNSANIICEHCDTVRDRKYGYLIQNKDKILQVGSSCLKDFLGHTDIYIYTDLAETLINLEEELEQIPPQNTEKYINVDILTYLSYVAEEIRRYGWISKGTAFEKHCESTAYLALEQMLPFSNEEYYPSEGSKTQAKESLEWIRNKEIDESNNYIHNLKTLCSLSYVNIKNIGYVASLIKAHQIELEREKIRKFKQLEENLKENSNNNYLGEVGERIKFNALLLGKQHLNGLYGTTTLLKFITHEGQTVIWFASGYKDDDECKQGKEYQVAGRVKKHQEYKGEKQTVVTRCKIKEVI